MTISTKAFTWTGWGLSILLGLAITFSAATKFMPSEEMKREIEERVGFPMKTMAPIGVVELACAALYVVPQTSVLGAVLLTGYLGGATATHVRINDNFVPPVVMGILIWVALCLRDPSLWRFLPLRRPGA